MKKLTTLLLAAAMVFGTLTGTVADANAIDFKAKGNWTMSFDYGQGGSFMSHRRGDFNPATGEYTKGERISGWGIARGGRV